MKTMKKYTKMLTALVLALVMAAISPLNAYASSGTGKYVSDVYVAYGKNAEEAIKTLKDKGFTPVEGNLNDGGKTYVMMGYKTIDDILLIALIGKNEGSPCHSHGLYGI